MLTTRPFRIEDEPAVINLWTRCGLVRPHNDPRKDIHRKSKVKPDMFLVGLIEGKLVATVMVGYEGHRGWINYLAVCPEHQKMGFGKQMMDEAAAIAAIGRLSKDQSTSSDLKCGGVGVLSGDRICPGRRRKFGEEIGTR